MDQTDTPLNRNYSGLYVRATKICPTCAKPFDAVKTHKEKYCSRFCYDAARAREKKCPDCGPERCKLHSRLKQAKWRREATRKEIKAKTLQVAYRQTTGRLYTLTLDEARQIIDDPPNCPYCGIRIPWQKLSIDHKLPTSRGGTNDKENLAWVDLDCNLVKGNLTADEYTKLLGFMDDNPELKQYMTTRLKAGGGFMYARRKS